MRWSSGWERPRCWPPSRAVWRATTGQMRGLRVLMATLIAGATHPRSFLPLPCRIMRLARPGLPAEDALRLDLASDFGSDAAAAAAAAAQPQLASALPASSYPFAGRVQLDPLAPPGPQLSQSGLLALPQAFGLVYLGEAFQVRCCSQRSVVLCGAFGHLPSARNGVQTCRGSFSVGARGEGPHFAGKAPGPAALLLRRGPGARAWAAYWLRCRPMSLCATIQTRRWPTWQSRSAGWVAGKGVWGAACWVQRGRRRANAYALLAELPERRAAPGLQHLWLVLSGVKCSPDCPARPRTALFDELRHPLGASHGRWSFKQREASRCCMTTPPAQLHHWARGRGTTSS